MDQRMKTVSKKRQKKNINNVMKNIPQITKSPYRQIYIISNVSKNIIDYYHKNISNSKLTHEMEDRSTRFIIQYSKDLMYINISKKNTTVCWGCCYRGYHTLKKETLFLNNKILLTSDFGYVYRYHGDLETTAKDHVKERIENFKITKLREMCKDFIKKNDKKTYDLSKKFTLSQNTLNIVTSYLYFTIKK
jgi:hypothetical protein